MLMGTCSCASPFYRRGTPPVPTEYSLHEWIHPGDLVFCMGRSCCCANPLHQNCKCSKQSDLQSNVFYLGRSALVFVVCLLVHMALIDCLQRMALVCQCRHSLFRSRAVRCRSHIVLLALQRRLVLQIVVVGYCTLIGIGVVLGVSRLVGGHLWRCVGLPAPPHCDSLSSWPFGWWCLVVVDGVGLCLRRAAEEMYFSALRACWLLQSSSWIVFPCVMWWYRQWYWLYLRWTHRLLWGRQNCYFVHTLLAPMWLFPKLGVVCMPLGWTGEDWSMSVLLQACVPSLRDCAGIVRIVWWGRARWLGVALLCKDFWQGSQSLGRWQPFWIGFLADPVSYTLSRMWRCSGAWCQGWACRTLLLADQICLKWLLSSSNLLLVVWLRVQLWKHH